MGIHMRSWKTTVFVLNILIPIHWFSVYQLQIPEKDDPFLVLDARYTYRECGIKMLGLPSKK